MNPAANDFIAREARFGTYNYEPIGVVLSRGEGVWVWDTLSTRATAIQKSWPPWLNRRVS